MSKPATTTLTLHFQSVQHREDWLRSCGVFWGPLGPYLQAAYARLRSDDDIELQVGFAIDQIRFVENTALELPTELGTFRLSADSTPNLIPPCDYPPYSCESLAEGEETP